MAYRVDAIAKSELAPSARAGCTNTECSKNQIKISKGELRAGVLVTIQERQSFKWRHWGCVTPQMIGNMKQKTEDNLEFLDGYEELPPDLQEKVSRVYEQGHVDDADWKGDLPQNRPGAKGFRSPALKKKKENDVTDNDNEKTPRKNTKKKRARVEDAEDEEEVPVAKKKKTPGRRGKKGDDRDEPDAVDEVRKPPVKGKGRPKKHTVVDEKAVSEEGGDAEDVEPPAKTTKKSRTSKMATAPAEDKEGSAADTPDVDMADIPKPKVSKKTKVNGAEEGQMAAKSKGSRRSSRNKT